MKSKISYLKVSFVCVLFLTLFACAGGTGGTGDLDSLKIRGGVGSSNKLHENPDDEKTEDKDKERKDKQNSRELKSGGLP